VGFEVEFSGGKETRFRVRNSDSGMKSAISDCQFAEFAATLNCPFYFAEKFGVRRTGFSGQTNKLKGERPKEAKRGNRLHTKHFCRTQKKGGGRIDSFLV